jgi:hypothetical protein
MNNNKGEVMEEKQMPVIEKEFQVHLLNEEGINSAKMLAEKFSLLLQYVRKISEPGRELALVATKLEEASFFAKKAMAQTKENQK